MRVLILDCGLTSSYHAMRTLARGGHEVHLSSPEKRSVFFLSRYCAKAITSPSAEDRAAYGPFLLELVRKGNYGALLFCGDNEAETVWDLRDQLERYVPCFLPDPRWREVAFSKSAAYRHVESLGIPIPRTFYPSGDDLGEVAAIGARVQFPAVVKGEKGSAGMRVRYSLNAGELIGHFREIQSLDRPDGGKPSVQEYVPGEGYVVHALFWRGKPMAVCSHRKDRELPVGGGVTTAATTVKYSELDEAAVAILESMQWHGLVKMDWKRDDRDGRFKFIELDPRVSASIDITRAAGADQVSLLCDLAADPTVSPRREYREGVHYLWLYPRDAVRHLVEPWRLPRSLLSLLREDTHWDLDLGDMRCTARALRVLLWYFKHQVQTRAVWKQDRERRRLQALLRGALDDLRPVPGP